MSNVTPTNTEKLDSSLWHEYKRVGLDNSGWIDGTTPITAENLNKGDYALSELLSEDIGYIYRIVSRLNVEIQSRVNDITELNRALTTEETTRAINDENLSKNLLTLDSKVERYKDARIRSDEDLLNQILLLNNKLTSEVSTLKNNLSTLDETLREISKELSSKITDTETLLKQEISSKVIEESTRAIERENAIERSIPLKVSQLENDSNYVTLDTLTSKEYVDKTKFNTEAILDGDTVIFACGNSVTLI